MTKLKPSNCDKTQKLKGEQKFSLHKKVNTKKSLNWCSFAFNNQNSAQTKTYLAGTCVSSSPAFRNSAISIAVENCSFISLDKDNCSSILYLLQGQKCSVKHFLQRNVQTYLRKQRFSLHKQVNKKNV